MAGRLIWNILKDGLGYTCEFRNWPVINNVFRETDMSSPTDLSLREAERGGVWNKTCKLSEGRTHRTQGWWHPLNHSKISWILAEIWRTDRAGCIRPLSHFSGPGVRFYYHLECFPFKLTLVCFWDQAAPPCVSGSIRHSHTERRQAEHSGSSNWGHLVYKDMSCIVWVVEEFIASMCRGTRRA